MPETTREKLSDFLMFEVLIAPMNWAKGKGSRVAALCFLLNMPWMCVVGVFVMPVVFFCLLADSIHEIGSDKR